MHFELIRLAYIKISSFEFFKYLLLLENLKEKVEF